MKKLALVFLLSCVALLPAVSADTTVAVLCHLPDNSVVCSGSILIQDAQKHTLATAEYDGSMFFMATLPNYTPGQKLNFLFRDNEENDTIAVESAELDTFEDTILAEIYLLYYRCDVTNPQSSYYAGNNFLSTVPPFTMFFNVEWQNSSRTQKYRTSLKGLLTPNASSDLDDIDIISPAPDTRRAFFMTADNTPLTVDARPADIHGKTNWNLHITVPEGFQATLIWDYLPASAISGDDDPEALKYNWLIPAQCSVDLQLFDSANPEENIIAQEDRNIDKDHQANGKYRLAAGEHDLRITFTDTLVSRSFTYTLEPGWNLLGNILNLDDNSRRLLAARPSFACNQTRKVYQIAGEADLSPNTVFWLYNPSGNKSDLTVSGILPDTQPTLPGKGTWFYYSAPEDSASLPDNCSAAFRWQDGHFTSVSSLSRGLGYFLFFQP